MSLLQEIENTDAQQVTDAAAVYCGLIRRADTPEPGDADELRRCMGILKLEKNDVAAHIQAVAQVDELESSIATSGQLELIAAEAIKTKAAAIQEARTVAHAMIDGCDDSRIFALVPAMKLHAADAKGNPLHDFENRADAAYQNWLTADGARQDRITKNGRARVAIYQLKVANPRAFAI